jgi:hypothetical protein
MMNHSVKEIRKRKLKRWAMNVATYAGLTGFFLLGLYVFVFHGFLQAMGW